MRRGGEPESGGSEMKKYDKWKRNRTECREGDEWMRKEEKGERKRRTGQSGLYEK